MSAQGSMNLSPAPTAHAPATLASVLDRIHEVFTQDGQDLPFIDVSSCLDVELHRAIDEGLAHRTGVIVRLSGFGDHLDCSAGTNHTCVSGILTKRHTKAQDRLLHGGAGCLCEIITV